MHKLPLSWSLLLVGLSACGGGDQTTYDSQPACPDGRMACFSPTSIASMDESCSVGCLCNPATDHEVCVGGRILACVGRRWQVRQGIYCEPGPRPDASSPVESGAGDLCYSPIANLSIAYQPGAVGCVCDPAIDADVCIDGVALMCIGEQWQAVIDGPCMPTVPRDAGVDQNPGARDVADDRASGADRVGAEVAIDLPIESDDAAAGPPADAEEP